MDSAKRQPRQTSPDIDGSGRHRRAAAASEEASTEGASSEEAASEEASRRPQKPDEPDNEPAPAADTARLAADTFIGYRDLGSVNELPPCVLDRLEVRYSSGRPVGTRVVTDVDISSNYTDEYPASSNSLLLRKAVARWYDFPSLLASKFRNQTGRRRRRP